MKSAIVTGAAGFAGYSLTQALVKHGYKVYAILRPGSDHNQRLVFGPALVGIELDSEEFQRIPEFVTEPCDVFYHLAWAGLRDDFYGQNRNIEYTIMALEAAAAIGCTRFVCTGSQAEYGMKDHLITEVDLPEPINAYGAAKLSALYLSKRRAEQLGIEWIWGRIFSLYGLYEPAGRMLPDLITKLQNREEITLSDCTQNWDYLDVRDAAEALVCLGEKGISGEIYNIANGDYRALRDYVEFANQKFADGNGRIQYGAKAEPYISLSPDVSKLKSLGWTPVYRFLEE